MTPKLREFFSEPVKRGADGKEYALGSTSLNQKEAEVLAQLVLESGSTKTLEIGLALGASAIAIAEALEIKSVGSRHVVLDPFQGAFGHVGLMELERLGLMHRVEFHAVSSEDFLYKASSNKVRFDFIFNDGAHSIGSKVTSAFFGDRCLGEGGVFAFHDAFITSTVACIDYLVRDRRYKPMYLPPDSLFKRWCRMLRYYRIHGPWYAANIIPNTCRSLVAVRKTAESKK